MSTYHQIGHHSKNLIFEPNLSNFQGAILSPVNYSQSEIVELIGKVRDEFDKFDIVFDPQLYYPHSDREILKHWSYFPKDFETVDLTDLKWWHKLVSEISKTISEINPNTICTPVIHPRAFNIDYYSLMNNISCDLCDSLLNTDVRVLQTALISLSDLADFNQVMKIASILTRTTADGVYLIFYSNSNPRRELHDPEELKGGMLLINTLQNNNIDV